MPSSSRAYRRPQEHAAEAPPSSKRSVLPQRPTWPWTPGRASVGQSVVGDVPRHEGAGADHGVAADRHAGQKDRPGAEARSFAHEGPGIAVEVASAARARIVRERHVGADEDVVLEDQTVVERDPALDRDAVAQDDVVLDEAAITDVAVPADPRTREDVHERPDPRAVADRLRGDEGGRMRGDHARP